MRLETFDRKNTDHIGAAKAGKHVMFLADGGVMKLGVLQYDPEENTSIYQFKVKFYVEGGFDFDYAHNTVMVFLDCDTSDCLCGLCTEV